MDGLDGVADGEGLGGVLPVLVLDDPHLLEALAQPSVAEVEQAQLLAVGDDLGEQQVLHALLGLLAGQQGLDLGVRDPETGPEFRVQGASPHHVAGLVGELLAYPELGCIHVLVELLEGEDPEGHVTGLVGHHVAEHRLQEGFLGGSEHQAEGSQGQSLDHHLHA